jgi:hypothetical protein
MPEHPRRHLLIERQIARAKAELEVAALGLPPAEPRPRPDAAYPDHLGEVNPIFREHLLRGLQRYIERPPTRVDYEGLRRRPEPQHPAPVRLDPAPVNRRRPRRG